MKIIVFGARGDVGSRVVKEALSRGHDVTAVVRSDAQAKTLPRGVTQCIADVANSERLSALMSGHDLAVSALRPPDGQEGTLVTLTRAVLEAASDARVRVLLVGGAASLKVPDLTGHTVLTAPGFLPAWVKPIAKACQAQYELCAAETETDWTYLCPPAMLTPGARTGHYRLGSDALVVDSGGNSAISMEDFAVALIDEAETPRHHRARFTVAY
ncbi:MAG: NAD(P)H-binding protein [Pseudomonadota bacterium]